MAAHDDEIGRARRFADQRDLGIAVGIERRGERIDRQKSVGLGERRDRARALAGRKRDRAVAAGDQRDQHEFLAAEFGGDAHRHARRDGLRGLGRQSGARADDRRDEGMEGEDRRGRKARQHHQRLVADDREAERLAGFERHAVHQDAGRAEPRHDAMRQIAGAFRRAAGEHHHVAGLERRAHGEFERGLVVGKRAERHRLAAGFE